MDSLAPSQYSTPTWVSAPQNVLPSQAAQRIVIPAGATNEPSVSTTNTSQTTRPGGSENPQPATQNPNQTPSQNDNSVDESAEQRQREQAVEQVLVQLRARDQEVRTHEQAHLSAAGPYATSGIQYVYQTGPDGQKYAIGGSVGIDTSAVAGDPEATLQKARVVQRAALAPAQPSGQDMKVAAQASQMMMQAQVEIQLQQAEARALDTEDLPNEMGSDSNPPPASASQIQTREADNPNSLNQSNQNQPNAVNPARNEFELRMSLQVQPEDMFAISA